jgi:putative transcriptional regulator
MVRLKRLAALALVVATRLPAQSELTVENLETGLFLVASRDLRDPNFASTVVLLTSYGRSGAMGLIVNRRSQTPLSRIFPALSGKIRADLIHEGGPVSRSGALALVRSKTRPEPDSRPVVADVYLVASKGVLDKLLNGGSHEDLRVYLGYAGWAPGQLEAEVEAGAWHLVRANEAGVFDGNPDTLWERLRRKATLRLAWRP